VRRVLVVGASSAIGGAIAADRAAAEHDVVLWGRDEAACT
jgi:short-subunit dehydrogenase